MKKKILIYSIVGAVFLVSGELFARYILGLGETPIYVENDKYEYIFAPNQHVKRFGNEIRVNEYSMRSYPLRPESEKVLIFGDSVINGGSLTSHQQLATTLLEREIKNTSYRSIQVLNISAGSWGPDNAFAYLKEYGNFHTSLIILVFSSHDAYDNMSFEKIIDVEDSYPSSQPYCALSDGFNRYLIPRLESLISSKKKIFSKIHKIDKGKIFNSGWNDFLKYSQANNIHLVVLLHPTKEEIVANAYNQNGLEIIDFLERNKIEYYLELNNIDKTYYRDSIHYNISGQQFLYQELYGILSNALDIKSSMLAKEVK